MEDVHNYTNFLKSRFSIDASSHQEKKIKDFIAAHKLPRSVYFELRMRELDKRSLQTKALKDTLKKMTEKRRLIVEWDLPKRLKPITKTLKIFTKSAGACNYVIDSFDRSHLSAVMFTTQSPNVTLLGPNFKISDGMNIATYAAKHKEIVHSSSINDDERFPLSNGWPSISAEVSLAVPIMKSTEEVLGVVEFSKSVHSMDYSFIDIEAVSLLTSLCGYMAEESEISSKISISLTFINQMMVLITQYLECTLPVESICSQLTIMNKKELGAEHCSFSLIKYVRERKVNINYEEDPTNPHIHVETKLHSQRGRSFSARSWKKVDGVTKKKERWSLGVPIVFNELKGGLEFQFLSHGKPQISDTKENLLETTCSFLCFILELHELSDSLFKQKRESIVINDMLKIQACHCSHELKSLEDSLTLYKCPDIINSFTWAPDISLPEETQALLFRNFVSSSVGHLFINESALNMFVLLIKRMLLQENTRLFFNHVLLTTHFMLTFLNYNKTYFGLVERDALMMVAVCHYIRKCNPSYTYIMEAIIKMFGINEKIPARYIEELLEKIEIWQNFFPCNYTSSDYLHKQKKYHKLLQLCKTKRFNHQKRSHRNLVILVIAINADYCVYFKNKIFLAQHKELDFSMGLSFSLPELEGCLDSTQPYMTVPKVLNENDCQHYQIKRHSTIKLINHFLQPWLNFLKIMFNGVEYLQDYLECEFFFKVKRLYNNRKWKLKMRLEHPFSADKMNVMVKLVKFN